MPSKAWFTMVDGVLGTVSDVLCRLLPTSLKRRSQLRTLYLNTASSLCITVGLTWAFEASHAPWKAAGKIRKVG
jgi:hypothetical protein